MQLLNLIYRQQPENRLAQLYRRSSGFTLIELLVVLAIVSTLGALVAPNLWRTYQRSSERLTVIEYGSEIGALRRELMKKRNALSLNEGSLVSNTQKSNFPAPPKGWVVAANSEMLFLPTGVTSGGQIEFESPTGNSWFLIFQPLDGAMDVELK